MKKKLFKILTIQPKKNRKIKLKKNQNYKNKELMLIALLKNCVRLLLR